MQNVTNHTGQGLDADDFPGPEWLKWFIIALLIFVALAPWFFDCRTARLPKVEFGGEAPMEMHRIERIPAWMQVVDNDDDEPLPRYSHVGQGNPPVYDEPPEYEGDGIWRSGAVITADVVGDELDLMSLHEDSE